MGTRCEIKNVNSIKFIQQAIEYESQRQVKILESGGKIVQETRLFDPNEGKTRTMRSKEESHDYRYFPDPDLPPLKISDQEINELQKKLPELPDDKKSRFIKKFNLTSYDAEVIVNDKDIANFFEEVAEDRDSKLVISWVTGEMFSYLKRINKDIKNSGITPLKIGSLIDLIHNQTISNRQAKEIFHDYINSDEDAKSFVETRGLIQVSDKKQIEKVIDSVLQGNGKMVEDYKNGKDKLFGFFIGQVMKLSEGKANPKLVNELLIKKLKE